MTEKDALHDMDVIFEKLIHIAETLEGEIDVYIKPPNTHSLRKRWEKAKKIIETTCRPALDHE